jgi:hypothetical protein
MELISESEMMHSKTELNTCTEEELHQALAEMLAHAQGELLSDAELQQFWQVCEEIQQRFTDRLAAIKH